MTEAPARESEPLAQHVAVLALKPLLHVGYRGLVATRAALGFATVPHVATL